MSSYLINYLVNYAIKGLIVLCFFGFRSIRGSEAPSTKEANLEKMATRVVGTK